MRVGASLAWLCLILRWVCMEVFEVVQKLDRANLEIKLGWLFECVSIVAFLHGWFFFGSESRDQTSFFGGVLPNQQCPWACEDSMSFCALFIPMLCQNAVNSQKELERCDTASKASKFVFWLLFQSEIEITTKRQMLKACCSCHIFKALIEVC